MSDRSYKIVYYDKHGQAICDDARRFFRDIARLWNEVCILADDGLLICWADTEHKEYAKKAVLKVVNHGKRRGEYTTAIVDEVRNNKEGGFN